MEEADICTHFRTESMHTLGQSKSRLLEEMWKENHLEQPPSAGTTSQGIHINTRIGPSQGVEGTTQSIPLFNFF
jgi:hypothetical protein